MKNVFVNFGTTDQKGIILRPDSIIGVQNIDGASSRVFTIDGKSYDVNYSVHIALSKIGQKSVNSIEEAESQQPL